MASTRAKQLPAVWIPSLLRVFAAGDTGAITRALAVVRVAPAPKDNEAELRSALLRLGRDAARPVELRLDALSSVRGGLEIVDAEEFSLLVQSVEPTAPLPVRTMAGTVLETARLSRQQRLESDAVARDDGAARAAAGAARIRR